MKKVKVGNATLLIDQIPKELATEEVFQNIWDIHPIGFNKIQMYDKEVYIPRWQQAFGKDYLFSKQVSKAEPISETLLPFLEWTKQFNSNYNGLLLNWYDSDLKHYIGKHRDSEVGLIKDSPIITISLGATRKFRMREVGKKGFNDLEVSNGFVLVIPWETNKHFTHEVPYSEHYPGKRISITVRAFK